MKKYAVMVLLILFGFSAAVSLLSVQKYNKAENRIAGAYIGGTYVPPSPQPSNTPVPPSPVPPSRVPPTSTPVPQQQQPSATPKAKSASPTSMAPAVKQTVIATTSPCSANSACITPIPTTNPDNGYIITVRIIRSDNKSMANEQVEIDGITYTVDQNNTVVIPDLALGDHQVNATVNGNEQKQEFVLGASDINQGVTVVLQADSVNFLYILLLILFVLILAAAVYYYLKKRNAKESTKK